MDAPRRTSSQLRLAPVLDLLERLPGAIVARWARLGWVAGYIDADQQMQLARGARLEAHEAISDAHERGRLLGRAQVRAELGLPPEAEVGSEDDTKRLAPCPIDPSRPCAVPAALSRKRDPDAC